jgi:hypothetical protein
VDAPDRDFPIDGGVVTWGHEVAVAVLLEGSQRVHSTGRHAAGVTARVRHHGFSAGASLQAGQTLFGGKDANNCTETLRVEKRRVFIFCRLML